MSINITKLLANIYTAPDGHLSAHTTWIYNLNKLELTDILNELHIFYDPTNTVELLRKLLVSQLQTNTLNIYNCLTQSIDSEVQDSEHTVLPAVPTPRKPVVTRHSSSPFAMEQKVAQRRLPKLVPSFFSGLPSECVRTYLKEFDSIAKLNGWEDLDKVNLLPFYLKGAAKIFASTLSSDLPWSDFSSHLLAHFHTPVHLHNLKVQLDQCTQLSHQSSMDFITEVHNLCNRVNPGMSESEIIHHILKGLREDLLLRIAVSDNSTISSLRNNLQKLEIGFKIVQDRTNPEVLALREQLHSLTQQVNSLRVHSPPTQPPLRDFASSSPTFRGNTNPSRQNFRLRTPRQSTFARQPQRSSSNTPEPPDRTSRCHFCMRAGHFVKECTLFRGPRCNKCHKFGHFTAQCFQNQKKLVSPGRLGPKSAYSRDAGTNTPLSSPSELYGLESPAYSFSVNPKNSTLGSPVINIGIFNTNIAVLLDTGSAISILDSSILPNSKVINENEKLHITTANSSCIDVLGTCVLSFKIQGQVFRHKFFAARRLSMPIILGADFLHSNGVVIDYSSQCIIIKNLKLKLSYPNNQEQSCTAPCGVIRNISDVVLPPRQSRVTHLDTTIPQNCYVTDYISLNQDYFTDNPLQVLDSYTTRSTSDIRIHNVSSTPQRILKNTIIGCIQPPLRSVAPHQPQLLHDRANVLIDINTNLSPSQYARAYKLLSSYLDVFATHSGDLGPTSLAPYTVKLSDTQPVALPPYRLAKSERVELDRQIQILLDAGIIRPSQSCYSSPAYLVDKHDKKSKRLVVNYTKLNEKVVSDKFPLPRIDTIFDSLQNASFFSQLDFNSAFFQQPLDERITHITAFATPSGLYEFCCLPQGLKNSPASFQRAINRLFSEYLYKTIVGYIDDIVVFSHDFDSQLNNLQLILERIRSVNLKVKTDKCKFFYDKIDFLGHSVSQQGILPLPSKIDAIQKFPTPTSVKMVRSFLGTAGYYRKFIQNYSKIAAPLTDLTKIDTTSKFRWESKHEDAFNILKDKLIQPPLLAHFNENSQIYIATDACKIGIGGVLMQPDSAGRLHPVQYLSRKLSSTESRWTTSEVELLSIVYCLNYWRPYVLGQKVIIYNDHVSLKYYNNIKNISSRLHRLALKLVDYDFSIVHKPGKQMVMVDTLSRHPIDQVIDHEYENDFSVNLIRTENISLTQKQDTFASQIYSALTDPDSVDKETSRRSRHYRIGSDDTVYYKRFNNTSSSELLLVPAVLQPTLLQAYHDDSAHLGITKTYKKLLNHYYWPSMLADVTTYVTSCDSCQKIKTPKQKPPGFLTPIVPSEKPFHHLIIDYLGPITSSQGYKYIIVGTCTTTKFVVAKPTRKNDASSTARFILDLINTYGTPDIISSDRGSHFIDKSIIQLKQLLGVSHKTSSSYNPCSQGLTERFNHTLMQMLSHYTQENRNNWSKYLDHVVFCHNTAKQASIGYSPFYLLHGFDPRSPIDIALAPHTTSHDILSELDKLQSVRKSIPNIMEKVQDKQKALYDSKHVLTQFNEGDMVLIREFDYDPTLSKKLQPRYRGPYTIQKKLSPLNYDILVHRYGKLVSDVFHIKRLKLYHKR